MMESAWYDGFSAARIGLLESRDLARCNNSDQEIKIEITTIIN